MLEAMTRNWGGIAFRGFLAVLFGLIAIFWPGPTVGVLVGRTSGARRSEQERSEERRVGKEC